MGSTGTSAGALVAGGLGMALASAGLLAHGALTWPLALALTQLAGALFVADALGHVAAGTVLDYLFERRVARLCPALRLHALATGDLKATESGARALLEAATGSPAPNGPASDRRRPGHGKDRR